MNEMNATNRPPANEDPDPLIDEVRTIRRSICNEFENELGRLSEHLRGVEEEYRTRTGRFADVPRQAEAELFPDAGGDESDPLLAELRTAR